MSQRKQQPAQAEPADTVPAKRRQARTERSREAILHAAEREFSEAGFGAARMIDIARAAGVSEKTLFNYFASKAALLEALTLRWFEARSAIFAEPETIGGATIAQVLPPDLERRLAELAGYRWLLAMTAAHTDLFVTHRQPRELQQRNFAARAQRVRQLQEQGVVRSDVPAAEICELYQALRNHLLGAWLTDGDGDFEALQQRFRRAMNVFLSGLRGGPIEDAPRRGPLQRGAPKRSRKSASSTR